MNCPNCGYKNRRGVNFCENCAYDFSSASAQRGKSTVFCANCGSKNAVGSRFCFKCGNALESAATTPVQAGPQVIVIQQSKKRRNWLGLLALLLLLLFGCALISSLVQVTPALARNLPTFLQEPAMAFGRWQQEADIPNKIRQASAWVNTALNDIFGGGQVAAEPDTGAFSDQAVCDENSNVALSPASFYELSRGVAPQTILFQGGLADGLWYVDFIFENTRYPGACAPSASSDFTQSCQGLNNIVETSGFTLDQLDEIRIKTGGVAPNGQPCPELAISTSWIPSSAQVDTGASDDQAACLDYSNVHLSDNSISSLGAGGSGPSKIVFVGLPSGIKDTYLGAQYLIGDTGYETDCSLAGNELICAGPQNNSLRSDGFSLGQIESIRFTAVLKQNSTWCSDLYYPMDSIRASVGSQGGSEVSAGPPMISVSQNTMCRKGPGSSYDAIGDLQVGESTEIVAKYSGGDWWVVENYGASGTCWLYGGYAQIIGDTSALPYWEAPALPQAEEGQDSGEEQGSITWTFNNYTSDDVCTISVSPHVSSEGGWTTVYSAGDIPDDCIHSGMSSSFTMDNRGSSYDIYLEVCANGDDCSNDLQSATITDGSTYDYSP
jgi:hypothetical protein